MSHEITFEELECWRSTHWAQFAASFSSNGETDKRLEVSLDGYYRVIDHGKERHHGNDPFAAIQEYNETP